MSSPPYRVETERFVLRCYEPEDAPLLKDAVDRSLEHLRPWMPWTPRTSRRRSTRSTSAYVASGGLRPRCSFVMGVLSPDDSRVLGGTGLHTRLGEGALEIGYWIAADAIGQGLRDRAQRQCSPGSRFDHFEGQIASRSASTRTTSASEQGDRRKLGFTREATLRRRLPVQGEATDLHATSTILDDVRRGARLLTVPGSSSTSPTTPSAAACNHGGK